MLHEREKSETAFQACHYWRSECARKEDTMNNIDCKRLVFDSPADPRIFTQALPLGNGSFGAMAYGTVDSEYFQLNQESVWSCNQRDRINPEAREFLPHIRELCFSGKIKEAEQVVYEHFLNPAVRLGHYEPLCDLHIKASRLIPHHSEIFNPTPACFTEYKRELDFENALYTCTYRHKGITFQREALISYPDQVMAIRLTSDSPLDYRIEMTRDDACDLVRACEGFLTLRGGGGSRPLFICMLAAKTDGCLTGNGNFLILENSREAVLYIAGRTDFYGEDPAVWCRDKLAAALKKGFARIRTDHINDYRNLFDRMSLTLDDTEENKEALTFFHYGRYLAIASSRPGSLPANLQGLWNKDFHPMWSSGYTLNINLEMNYWLAEAAALPECHLPLMEFIHRMVPAGRDAAERLYGCRGAAAFHNTDIYGDCAPNESWMPASYWPMGLAWLALHIIEHYRFTQDLSFAGQYYDDLKEISLFFIDFLVRTEDGILVTCPSSSPENTYLLPDGYKATLCYGPAMDTQIIRELWKGMLEISKALGRAGEPLCREISERINDLPKDRIGKRGQLLEWLEEYEEWEPGHRHISHLFALYPGNGIDRDQNKDLACAARKTLQERLALGGGQTGWSRGWLINLYARLGDGEEAHKSLMTLIHEQTAENLFDLHPILSPGMSAVFQIDGNFGGAAGILEMLIQSQGGVIRLLPALPAAWKNGHIHGVRARGNIAVDMTWENGKVTDLHLTSPIHQNVMVEINGEKKEFSL